MFATRPPFSPPDPPPGPPQAHDAVPFVAERVVFGYTAGAPTVRDVSVSLPAGRLCCLLGPNAAGKSTLVKLMLGQLVPWSGVVRLAGQPVADLPALKRARLVSYVPQRGAAGFAFTVRQVVEMGRFAGGPHAAAVEAALRAADLTALSERVFAQLSGGQQQRVLIARAMAQAAGEGRAMLLDEPSSSLDLWHVHELMRLLREQAARGLAVLVVLHDLNLAARYADDVWLMHEGRLVAAGEWREVLRPELLEPVYRMPLEAIHPRAGGRPMFHATGSDRL